MNSFSFPGSRRDVRPSCGGSSRDGFTLVELLVVISIVALLVSMLLPALDRARDAARIVDCLSRKRQLGIVVHTFAADHNNLLPQRIMGQDSPSLWTNGSRQMDGYHHWEARGAWTLHKGGTWSNTTGSSFTNATGTMVGLGYVPAPELLFCPGFQRKPEQDYPSPADWLYDQPEYANRWEEMTDGDNQWGAFWTYSGVANLMFATPGGGTDSVTDLTLDTMASKSLGDMFMSPALYGCLNLAHIGNTGPYHKSHNLDGLNIVYYDGSASWLDRSTALSKPITAPSPVPENGDILNNRYPWKGKLNMWLREHGKPGGG